MPACGGVFSFMVKGKYDSVRKFLPHLKYAHRAAMGIAEGLVRYSVGIEDA